MLKTFSAAILAVAFASPALADGPLQSEMTAWIVTYDDAGDEVLSETVDVAPGSLVEYRLVYTNIGDVPLGGLVVSSPVPEATDLELGSETSEIATAFEASIDNGESWGVPPLRTDDGEPADSGDYDLVRWSTESEIEPGETWEFAYRVSVE
ncbi:MAG: hypothetical protein AAFX86_13230 [Pseudomonadota bacterium]